MASVNKVILIGHLGSDPEVRFTQGGSAVANFNIATNEVWTDKNQQRQERTEWHRIVVWGKQAEQCRDYLSKGRQVYIEGRLQTRDWEDKEGHKRSTTEINAQRVLFLDRGQGGGSQDHGSPAGGHQGESGGSDSGGSGDDPGLTDEDIPF